MIIPIEIKQFGDGDGSVSLCRSTWDVESEAPRWFREASAVWHPSFEAFAEFWENCGEIWAFVDSDCETMTTRFVVYIEFLNPTSINIHVSVISSIDREKMIESLKWLKAKKADDGVTSMVGWLLDKNRGIRKIAEAVGFRESGAKMDYGVARGRVLRWVQFTA